MATLPDALLQDLLTNYPFKEMLDKLAIPPPPQQPSQSSISGISGAPTGGVGNMGLDLLSAMAPPAAPTAAYDTGGGDSQDIAMSDPAYRALIAKDLLSQGRILGKTTYGPRWMPPDNPNAVLDQRSLLADIGGAPLEPGGRNIGQPSQASRGSFSVMGGPQVSTLGDLAQVGEVIKKLPQAFQSLILQRLTGMQGTDEATLARQLQLEKFKHQLAAPERDAAARLRELQATSTLQRSAADEAYKAELIKARDLSQQSVMLGRLKDFIKDYGEATGPGGNPQRAAMLAQIIKVINEKYLNGMGLSQLAAESGLPEGLSEGPPPAPPLPTAPSAQPQRQSGGLPPGVTVRRR